MTHLNIIVVCLSYSINPFLKKAAISGLNDYTGYAIIQATTAIGNVIYLYIEKKQFQPITIKPENLRYSLASSALTILSSYRMTKLLKNNYASDITTKIQVLTIVSSYIVDYLFNLKPMNTQQIMGIFFMVSGILITKT